MKVLIFLSVVVLGGAVIQEMSLHQGSQDQIGNSYIFREGVPDITIYPFLDKIVRGCHNSGMALYTDYNYEGTVDTSHINANCHDFNATYKSMRFFGNRNTSVDSVSLFPETNLRGEEIVVDRSPYGGIPRNMLSLAYTGRSVWTVFEGSNFDGKSACLPQGFDTNSYALHDVTSLNITQVRSLVKGCIPNVTPEMRRQLQESV